MKHIELITYYLIVEDDLVFSDNHGRLTRCGQCRYADGEHRRCRINGITGEIGELDYCSRGKEREEETA